MSRPLLVAYRALGLGDLLTAVPALRALAAAFPEHQRVLAAPWALAGLVRLTGAVDEVVDCAPLAPLPQCLHGADVAVNLHGRGPQSHKLLLAAGPRRLIAFGRPPDAVWRSGEHEVARWCRLLVQSGIPADPRDLAITGSAAERPLADRVARAAGLPDEAVLAGRTDLLELTAAVAAAARVTCGDTGIAHLATALGIPSVVLFGPTPPAEWGPPRNRRHVALWAGRRGDPHADEPDPSLLEIRVTDVVDALDGAAAAATMSAGS
jgi:ADP-heptose:LPS heptosyltransferase